MWCIINDNIFDIRNLWCNEYNYKIIYSYYGKECKTYNEFRKLYPSLSDKSDSDIYEIL